MKFRKICLLFLSPIPFFGIPVGGSVGSGVATMKQSQGNLEIHQETAKALLNWENFSIEKGEKVTFIQPREDSITFNKVVGRNISKIHGKLEANGIVFLINPHGTVIGPSGEVVSKGFLATTLPIDDELLLGKSPLKFQGDEEGIIVNEGKILGSTFLIAQRVENQGYISGDRVGLFGTNCVELIDPFCEKYSVRIEGRGSVLHQGTIEAIQTEIKAAGGVPLSLSVGGVIDARKAVERNGEIYLEAEDSLQFSGSLIAPGGTAHLLADEVVIDEGANIDLSHPKGGGTLLVGGDYQGNNEQIKNAKRVFVKKNSFIKADALEEGDGGRLIFWADEQNLFFGQASVQGGNGSGNGGFVEVSCPKRLVYEGFVDGRAAFGKSGELLLDPTDVTIGGVDTMNYSFDGSGNFSSTSTPVVIPVGTLNAQLASTNVTINTTSGFAGNGTITITPVAINWATPNTLTLIATRNIVCQSGGSITSSNAGPVFPALVLTGQGTGAGTYVGVLLDNFDVLTASGSVSITGTGGTIGSLNHGVAVSNGSTITLTTQGADLNITGNTAPNPGGSFNIGAYIESVNSIITTNGNITISGTCNSGINTMHGIVLEGIINNAAVTGNVNLTGTSLLTTPLLTTDTAGFLFNALSASGAKVLVTGGANVNIQGTCGNTGGVREIHGVLSLLAGGGAQVSTNTGNISIVGTTQGDRGSRGNALFLANISSVSGDITLSGTVNPGTVGSPIGLDITFGSTVTTAGNIFLNGSSPAAFLSSVGMFVFNSTVTSTAGNIVINSVGDDIGVYITNTTNTPPTVSAGGTLNITATAISGIVGTPAVRIDNQARIFSGGPMNISTTDASDSIEVIGASPRVAIGDSMNQNGLITLTTDIFSINPGITINQNLATGSGIRFVPFTPNGTIRVGLLGGNLNIPQTTLNQMIPGTASGVIFGLPGSTSNVQIQNVTVPYGLTFNCQVFEALGSVVTNNNNFIINAPNPVNTITFTGTVNPGTQSVIYNGGSGNDTINLVNTLQPTFNGIFNGGAGGSNTVNGPNAVSLWNITGANSSTLGSIAFTNFETINGGNMADTFNFSPGGSLSGAINGNAMNDTIIGPSTGATFVISGVNTGSITGILPLFTSIENLTGSTGSDQFVFSGATPSISGTIDGGAGTNTFDYSSYTAGPAIVVLPSTAPGVSSYSNINNYIGNSGSSFTASNIVNLWSFIGVNSGTVNGIGFSNFATLNGGALADTFDFTPGGSYPIGTINGSGGTNELVGPLTNTYWNLTGPNSGNITGLATWSNIQNLTGLGGADTFDFTAPGATLSGILLGGGGSNTILGPNLVNNWFITALNDGNLPGVINGFISIQNLVGGNLADTFIFSDQQGLTGSINGGAPAAPNILDYTLYSTPATVSFATPTSGNASNLGGGFSNIGSIIGNFNTTSFPIPPIVNPFDVRAKNALFASMNSSLSPLASFLPDLFIRFQVALKDVLDLNDLHRFMMDPYWDYGNTSPDIWYDSVFRD